jgi:hypothetical protein
VNTLEQAPRFEEMPDFGMGSFDISEGFDINAAFQEAIQGVASDTELALEEKVRRMEVIVSEGASEVYRGFVDFRQMAAEMEMLCSHDHALNQSIQDSDTLSGFIDSYKADDGHNHGNSLHDKHSHKKDDDKYGIDPKTGKKIKKKKRSGWFSMLMK